MSALEVMATPKRQVNVLQHILGYFTDQLDSPARQELVELIAAADKLLQRDHRVWHNPECEESPCRP